MPSSDSARAFFRPPLIFPALALALAASALSAVGCATAAPDLAELSYAPELKVDLEGMTLTPAGVYFQDISVGVGREVREGDQVTIHYMGWFVDGELFDSSLASGEAIGFTIGEGVVIEGWEVGLKGMREGGRRRLVVPSNLAYGSRGIPGAIPGNATLVFEVQLLRIAG